MSFRHWQTTLFVLVAVLGQHMPTAFQATTGFVNGRLSATALRTSSSVASAWITTEPPQQQSTNGMPPHIQETWGIQPNLDRFQGANFPLGSRAEAPPILELPHFLTANECRAIQDWAKHAIENGAEECDDYLNYRVNKEVEEGGQSQEGKTLIDEFDLEETQLSAAHKGGFRVRLDDAVVETMLKSRLLDVLGMPNRSLVFEEGAWIRPTPRTVVIRDKTVVFYGPGNGVPPHVDGKDGTLLVYLCDVPEGVGGRTVFPEDGFSQTPKQGTALLYRSKTELLHYSEAMTSTDEKWIMQLLLDFNHDYQPGDVVTDFRTGESYVFNEE